MSTTTIRSELTKRLQAWADAQSPVVQISHEGEAFTKPTDGSSFLQAFVLPAITVNPTLSGRQVREVGIFQVNCWVKEGGALQGAGRSDRLAQSIIDLFPIVPKFSVVSVERTPYTSPPILQDGYRVTPVTIQYRLETSY